jgi:hypothetical protein
LTGFDVLHIAAADQRVRDLKICPMIKPGDFTQNILIFFI